MAKNDLAISEADIRTEKVSCALCGSDDSYPSLCASNIKQRCAKEYTVAVCRKCGLAFTSPRPSKDSLARYYSGDDPEKACRKPALYERLYFSLFRKIPIKGKGRLLDVGCGSGRYIYTLKEKGWDVKGIDIGYTKYGRDVLGLDITEGDLSGAGFSAESFDAITFWWTFEHMDEPVSVLRQAHRLLKKGGVVIIGVHNIASLEARIFGKYWFHLFLPKHLYHYSPESLTRMLKKGGFANVKVRHDLFSFGMLGSLQNYLNARGVDISLTNPLFYALSLIFDIVPGLFGRGGLITAYAYKD